MREVNKEHKNFIDEHISNLYTQILTKNKNLQEYDKTNNYDININNDKRFWIKKPEDIGNIENEKKIIDHNRRLVINACDEIEQKRQEIIKNNIPSKILDLALNEQKNKFINYIKLTKSISNPSTPENKTAQKIFTALLIKMASKYDNVMTDEDIIREINKYNKNKEKYGFS